MGVFVDQLVTYVGLEEVHTVNGDMPYIKQQWPPPAVSVLTNQAELATEAFIWER
jgi:hypothetical protein